MDEDVDYTRKGAVPVVFEEVVVLVGKSRSFVLGDQRIDGGFCLLLAVPPPLRRELQSEVPVGPDVVGVRPFQLVGCEECFVLNKRVITAWVSKSAACADMRRTAISSEMLSVVRNI